MAVIVRHELDYSPELFPESISSKLPLTPPEGCPGGLLGNYEKLT